MRYGNAKNLHNEDEIIVKRTGKTLRVVNTEIVARPKKPYVWIYTEDGNCYLHTEVR